LACDGSSTRSICVTAAAMLDGGDENT
jgi:hypothetical protein